MKNKFSQYSDTRLAGMLREKRKIAEAAFTELYDRHAAKVHTYCACMLGSRDEAADILQETFIRFHKYAQKKDVLENVSGYIITISRNLCLNHIRNNRRTVPIGEMDFAGDDGIRYEEKETFDMIMTAIDLLDEKYREPFILREFDGLAYQEIADICDLSLSNAKSRVARARHQLANVLDPYMKNKY
ncbi:MAG: RNA polymerase sigma factor [Candidatus Kapaibacterium sp.]